MLFSIGTKALFASAALLVLLAPPSAAQTYKIDDGTPGYGLSYAFHEDFAWLNVLSVPRPVTLTSIEAILGDAPEGSPVTLCIWRDLGGSGQPWEGLLLTRLDTMVKNSGKQLLTEYEIPPTQVSGTFFVGAFLTTNASISPATLDPHTPTLGRSWFATGYGPGTFDPTYLGIYSWYAPPTIGIQGVFMLRANGINGPTPEARCVAKTNSLGCVPELGFSGTPSASAGGGFTIVATNVLSQKSGMLVYSLNGLQMVPFAGGNLCIVPPLRRTPMIHSGGSAVLDCSGSYAFDFNAWIAVGADPALVAGTTVDGQFWSRDPGFAGSNSIGLTQAAHFGIAP